MNLNRGMSTVDDVSHRLAIRAGQLFDGTGADAVKDAVVIVEGERIVAAGSEAVVSTAGADRVLDLRPCTLMPGLIDAHVHIWGRSPGDRMPYATGPITYRALRSAGEARALLQAGFTAVRDLGSQTSVQVKRAIDDGVIPGPRMLAAGMAIARTRGPWFAIAPDWRWVRAAEGIDACRRAVHLALREGSSVIKIGSSCGRERAWGEVPTYTVQEIQAMVEEAHTWGVRVAAHAMGTPGVRNAVLGGVDTVEHAYNIDEDTLGLIIERGTFVVPTLRIMHENPSPWAQKTFRDQLRSLRKAHEAGARLALGTDSTGDELTRHGPGNALEFKLLAEVLSPREALISGTLTAAQAMGLDHEIGTVEAGKFADLVAVHDDPLQDLGVLQRVVFVMQGGQIVVEP